MNKTLDTLKEMLEMGMIDYNEYEEERAHYFFLVTSVQMFEEKIQEKKMQLESIKRDERTEKMCPRIEKLLQAFEDGIISVDEFILWRDEVKRTKDRVKNKMDDTSK